MKRIFICLLSVLITFNFIGCSGNKSEESGTDKRSVYSNTYLLEDGKSEYKVVVPENSTSMENTAVSELVVIFQESTGVELPVITDAGLSYNETAKYISIGNTKVLQTANIKVSEKAEKVNGFAIKTKGDSLFFIGGEEYGIVYAVYEFLFQTLHFEQFYTDTYTLDRGVTDIRLQLFDFEDAPAITRVLGIQDYYEFNPSLARRVRLPYSFSNVFAMGDIYVNGNKYSVQMTHNTLVYIPKEEFAVSHPNFFSDDGTQLCYTAHGNAEELSMMVDIVVDGLKQNIRNNHPQGRFVHNFSNMDGTGTCCTCNDCLAMKSKYKGNAGAYVIFMNRVVEEIMDWMKNDEEGKQYYSDEFRFELSSYQAYLDAPVIQDADGNWHPIDDSVILHPNIIVNVDPVYANYMKNLEAETNKSYRISFDKWAAVSRGEIMVWTYNMNLDARLFPLDTYNSMIENYKLYSDYNCELFLEQSLENMCVTGWYLYKTWVYAKLTWNPYQNANELENRYFAGMYGPAEKVMHRFFDSYRNYSLYQQYELNFCPQGMTLYQGSIMSKRYWSKNILNQWMGYIDDAIKSIDPLKETEPKLYDTYYRNIVAERVFLSYALIKLYSESLGQNLRQYQQMFIDDMRLCNIGFSNFINEVENAMKGGN